MPLRRPWRPLERAVLREVPDRYGVYEFGDGSGTILEVGHGPLRDVIKEALAYDAEAEQVRFEVAPNRRAAEREAGRHRERLAER
ncbi:MAG: DUF7508 domain-containing protein [Halobacteriota archaeon]